MKAYSVIITVLFILLIIYFVYHMNDMKKNYIKINKPKDGTPCILPTDANGVIKNGICI